MTTIREITTRAYWSAAKLLNDRLPPADRATLCDTLGHIATHAPERIARAAAARLEREPADDGGYIGREQVEP